MTGAVVLDSGPLNEQPPIRSRAIAAPAFRTPFWSILLVAAAFSICLFSGLGALGFVGPDEPRYASVARAMAEKGDWITPRLNGRPWFEKPILYYWTAATTFRAFGVSEFAARLPSALAAALATLAVAWAAFRCYGKGTAWLTLLLLPCTISMVGFTRAATPDMLFSGLLAAAMVAASEMVGKEHAGNLARIVFGAFLGGATLAKGPAAVVLAGGSILLWAIAARRPRDSLRFLHPWAITAFCFTALPWYVLCAVRNPEFLRVFLVEHNVARYFTPVFHHPQPFWFFIPILLLAVLPWTLLLVGVARDAIQSCRGHRLTDSPGLFFACWVIFPVLFFSASDSKLPGYILPAVPPLALLMARSLAWASAQRSAWASGLLVGVGATYVVLALTAGYWLQRLPPQANLTPNEVRGWLAVTIAGGVAAAVLSGFRRPMAGTLMAALLLAVLVEGANWRVLPRLDPQVSPRAAAGALLVRQGATGSLSVFGLQRAWKYGLDFYLHREVPEWTPDLPPSGWVYTTPAGLAELIQYGGRWTVVYRGSLQVWLVRVEGVASRPAIPEHH